MEFLANERNCFDGDILTGFQGDSPDGHWVGLRLPEPSQVGWIRFIPRNDGNCIEIGDKYQLMMYDDCQWKVLATRIAASDVICFPHVPSGGLYLLSNLTKVARNESLRMRMVNKFGGNIGLK